MIIKIKGTHPNFQTILHPSYQFDTFVFNLQDQTKFIFTCLLQKISINLIKWYHIETNDLLYICLDRNKDTNADTNILVQCSSILYPYFQVEVCNKEETIRWLRIRKDSQPIVSSENEKENEKRKSSKFLRVKTHVKIGGNKVWYSFFVNVYELFHCKVKNDLLIECLNEKQAVEIAKKLHQQSHWVVDKNNVQRCVYFTVEFIDKDKYFRKLKLNHRKTVLQDMLYYNDLMIRMVDYLY